MSNTFGRIFRITTWGESHGPAVGVVVDGTPAGLKLSPADIQRDLDRRRPGQSKVTSSRQELDQAEILSGVFNGKTLGTPISIMVRNQDVRSKDYDALQDVYRPGHADFTWQAKYGLRDARGSGRASGRETVGRVAGGAVARTLLRHVGIDVLGFVKEISNVKSQMSNLHLKSKNLNDLRRKIEQSIVRCPDEKASAQMVKLIEQARAEGDSVGGIVEIMAVGVPAGWGEPVFGKLSADLAGALMSIPAVKAVEIGAGFPISEMRGSESNDQFKVKSEKLKVKEFVTISNNAGGISGGISNGMPIVARIAVKPTSSISQEQETVNSRGQRQKIKITGRHDPCLCPRVVPVAEAMMALVLADHYLMSRVARL